VLSNGGATVTPGETYDTAVLSYTVTNEGNAEQGYALDIVYNTGTNSELVMALEDPLTDDGTPDLGEYALYIDVNNDGLLDLGDTWYNPENTTSAFNLLPDTKYNVLVVAGILTDAAVDHTGSFTVVAQTLDAVTGAVIIQTLLPDIDTVDVVFLDDESDDSNYILTDAFLDGKHSDDGVMTVEDAVLAASKTVDVINQDAGSLGCFDIGGNTGPIPAADADLFAIPGACVEYTITVSNTGNAEATNVALSDDLPTGVTFAGIVRFDSAVTTNLSSADFYSGEGADVVPTEASGTVTATEATIAPTTGTVTLVIRAIVN